jgi:hypothetical protein
MLEPNATKEIDSDMILWAIQREAICRFCARNRVIARLRQSVPFVETEMHEIRLNLALQFHSNLNENVELQEFFSIFHLPSKWI